MISSFQPSKTNLEDLLHRMTQDSLKNNFVVYLVFGTRFPLIVGYLG